MPKIAFLLLCLAVGACNQAWAAMADFKDAFVIDLEEDKLPAKEELEKSFFRENTLYNPKYKSFYDLQGKFDSAFSAAATAYGRSEKRLAWPEEKQVLMILEALPERMYPYIGPMLFEVPNMSEKVLNMPGIKETKNKFPEVVAEQLKDVKDIEFLSPFLYYILMPEVWPENYRSVELPQMLPAHPKVIYDRDFYLALKKLVVPEDYMPGSKSERIGRSNLRTVNPTPFTLLTSADVQAFAQTIDAVEEWYVSGDNRFQLAQLTSMWLEYDRLNGDKTAPGLKDMVNPCRRLVQKAQIMGRERELAALVAGEGFTLYEWAYTCDKTIKAYRLLHISSTMTEALRNYRNGVYDEETDKLSPQLRDWRYSTMQALSEMYAAPLADVAEVRKNRTLLNEKWKQNGYKQVGVPLSLFE